MEPEQQPADESLQFNHVESADDDVEGVACTACQQPVNGYYYQINGNVVCVPCREELGAAMTGGSGLLRLIKAVIFGAAAGAVGAGIYFAVLKLSGYEFGLIAILVGLMVGGAVKAGSQGRGGWVYQITAVALTYLAIIMTYVPTIYGALKNESINEARTQMATATAPEEAEADMAMLATVEDGDVKLTGFHVALLLVISFVIAFIAPFLEFSLMGFIIIGIGLYTAWQLPKRVVFDVAGPFEIGVEQSEAPSEAAPLA